MDLCCTCTDKKSNYSHINLKRQSKREVEKSSTCEFSVYSTRFKIHPHAPAWPDNAIWSVMGAMKTSGAGLSAAWDKCTKGPSTLTL